MDSFTRQYMKGRSLAPHETRAPAVQRLPMQTDTTDAFTTQYLSGRKNTRRKPPKQEPKPKRDTGFYSPENTPSFEPENAWRRTNLTGVTRGAAAGFAAGHLNAAGTLLDLLQNKNPHTVEQKKQLQTETGYLRDLRAQYARATDPAEKKLLGQKIDQKQFKVRSLQQEINREQKYTQKGVDKLQGTADKLAQLSAQENAMAKKGLGKAGQFAVDLGTAGLQMGADIATGAPLVSMFSRASGSAAQEARHSGADLDKQALYGIGSGTLAVATEKISNVGKLYNKAFGAGVLDKAIEKAVAKMGGSKLGMVALAAISEGGEEFVEALFQPVLKRATYDPQARFNLDEALYETAIGAVLGGLGTSSQYIVSGRGKRAAPPTVETQEGPLTERAAQDTPVGENLFERTGEPLEAPDDFVVVAEEETAVPAPVDRVVSAIQKIGRGQMPTNSEVKSLDFNDPQVRQQLQQAGVDLPAGAASLGALKARIRTAVEANAAADPVQVPGEDMRVQMEEAPVERTEEYGRGLDDVDADIAPPEQNPSVGAADADFSGGYAEFQSETDRFHPINEAAAERTRMERGRAETEVPVQNPRTGKDISKTVSTIVNSPITSNEFAAEVEKAIADGKYDVLPIGDKIANAAAERAIRTEGGYKSVADSFSSKVENGGRIGKLDMAKAIAAFNNAISEKDHMTAFRLMDNIIQSARTSAQAVQAMNLFNRLTPEGRLLTLRRFTEKNNAASNGAGTQRAVTKKDVQEIEAVIQEQREDAINIIRTLIDSFAEKSGRQRTTLEDVLRNTSNRNGSSAEVDSLIASEESSWVDELAKALGRDVEQKLSPKKQRERTAFELISSDLRAFMGEYFQKRTGPAKKARTAADRINDYMHNKEAYHEAWEKAQNQLLRKYDGNDEMLAALDEWAYSTLGYRDSGADAVLLKAVADAALEQELGSKEIIIRGEYDADALADEISNEIIKNIQPNAADARIIKDAARRFVERKAADAAYQRMKSAENAGREISDNGGAKSYFDGDIRKAMRDVGAKMGDVIRQGAKSKEALATQIADMLITEYHVSENGARRISADIADQFQRMVKQSSEARLESMFREKEGRGNPGKNLFEELGNMGAFTNPRFNMKAAAKVFGSDGIVINQELAEKYLNAETDEARSDAWGSMIQDVANQMPSTIIERADTLRYLAMLANPTTHIGNISGNVLMVGARKAKNAIGTVLENVVIKDKQERTKAILTGSKADRALTAFAKEQYESADKQESLGVGKYQEGSPSRIGQEINDARRRQTLDNGILGGVVSQIPLINAIDRASGRALQKAANANSAALEAEDAVPNKWAYVDSFAQALKAKGVSAERARANPNDPRVVSAREYAISEAQKATFRNTTALSSALSSFGRYQGKNAVQQGLAFGFNAEVPFKATTANVMTTGMKYSPAGIAKALSYDAEQVSNGKMTAAELIDDLSAGLTGSGVMALGMYLAAQGLLTAHAGDDDNKKEQQFRRQMGEQDYALNIGGKTYTIDWAAPVAMPLIAGAAFIENMYDKNNAFLGAIDAMFDGTTEVLLETTLLSSLDDLISGIPFADNKAQYLASNVASNYMRQFFPTIGSKIASAMDSKVRRTYIEPGSGQAKKDMDAFQQSIKKKIPGLRQTLQPSVDLWGKEVSNGDVGQRLVQSFLSRSNIREKSKDRVDMEVMRLYNKLKDNKVLPASAVKEISYTDENERPVSKRLTAEQYTAYSKDLGKTRYDLLNSAFNSSWYKDMPDAEKSKYIDKVYAYAKAAADSRFGAPISEKWMRNVKNAQSDIGVSPAEFISIVDKYGSQNFSGSSYEKIKTAHSIDMSVDDYFRFRNESKSLIQGRSRSGKKRSDNSTDKDEVRLWAKRNGYESKTQVLMKMINAKW